MGSAMFLGIVGTIAGFWLLLVLCVQRLKRSLRAGMATHLAERERAAREIEDSLLQSMEGLILRFQIAADKLPAQDSGRCTLEEALREADGAMEQVRKQLSGSQTVRSRELPQAFAALGRELRQEHAAGFSVAVTGRPRELQPLVRDEIYRIGREAITNSFLHARAERCETEIYYDGRQFRIGIRDDGCGLDTRVLSTDGKGKWGLPGMWERAQQMGARLEVWSRPGMGTEIELLVPAAVAYQEHLPGSRWLGLIRWPG